MTWQQLATASPYKTAQAIADHLAAGNLREASLGLEELIEAVARSERRALKSQLLRLMAHVIKWLCQPDQRSRSWAATIQNGRDDIRDIQEETPSLTDDVIREMWDRVFVQALRQAEGEMNRSAPISNLTWEQVFNDSYPIPG